MSKRLVIQALSVALLCTPAVWLIAAPSSANAGDQELPDPASWNLPDPDGEVHVVPVLPHRTPQAVIAIGGGASPYDCAVYRGLDPRVTSASAPVSKLVVSDAANDRLEIYDFDVNGWTHDRSITATIHGDLTGVATDAGKGHIYVLEEVTQSGTGAPQSLVRVFGLDGLALMQFEPEVEVFGGSLEPMSGLTGIDTDADGNVYVTGLSVYGVHEFSASNFVTANYGNIVQATPDEVWGSTSNSPYVHWADVSVDRDGRLHGIGAVLRYAFPSPQGYADAGIIDTTTGFVWSGTMLGTWAPDMGVDAKLRDPKTSTLEVSQVLTDGRHANLFSISPSGVSRGAGVFEWSLLDKPIGCESVLFDDVDYPAGELPIQWTFVCSSGNGRVVVYER